MMKKKRVIDKEKSEQKKIFRIPMARSTEFHRDKTIYNRKFKHKAINQ